MSALNSVVDAAEVRISEILLLKFCEISNIVFVGLFLAVCLTYLLAEFGGDRKAVLGFSGNTS